MLEKMAYLYGVTKQMSQTYLVGFCLMDVGPIACGLAFNGYEKDTGKPKFDRVQSVNLWNYEFSCTVKDLIASWNMSVAKWLKYYVYLRFLPNDKSKGGGAAKAIFATFLASAVWHGFYPGHYIFFVTLGFLDYVSKLYGYVLMPFVHKVLPEAVIYFISWFFAYSWFSYVNISFFLLSLENSRAVYGSMYYIGHIIILASIPLL